MPKQRSWILLRGLGRETGHWHNFPEVLQKTFPQDEIRLLDLPGAGAYRKAKVPMSISGMGQFLRGELKKNPTK